MIGHDEERQHIEEKKPDEYDEVPGELQKKREPNEHDKMLEEFEATYQKDPGLLKENRKGLAILRLMRMVPDFAGFFSKETLLPVVMLSFELISILDVDIEKGTFEFEYGLSMDWFDIFTKAEYDDSRNRDYFSDRYKFQPNCVMKNVRESDIEESSSKSGIRFDARYRLGSIEGIEEEFVLVGLKKTMRGRAIVKQDFDITAYPVDKQAIKIGFEMKTLGKNIVQEVNARVPKTRKLGTSKTKVFCEFNDLHTRVKDTGTDPLICSNSGFSYHFKYYPVMLPNVTKYKEFIIDSEFKVHKDKTLYEVNTWMYRDSHAFLAKDVFPVLLIVAMTFFINALDATDVAERLSILMTLFLTLYAHKYVVLDKVETNEMTTIEFIIIVGYICMFLQGALIATHGIMSDNGISSSVGSYGNILLGVLILLVCGVYTVVLKDHAKVTKRIKQNNGVVLPKELLAFCSEEIKPVLRKSSHYQESAMAISKLEKPLVDAMLEEIIGNPSNILVQRKDWPESMFQDYPADQRVADWLQRKVKELAIDSKPIWPLNVNLQVKVKKKEDIAIKLFIREKLINDRYRTTFKYQTVDQANSFIRNLVQIARNLHEIAIIKFDFNLNDVSSLQVAKIYVVFKGDGTTKTTLTRNDGYLLEIMFLSEDSSLILKNEVGQEEGMTREEKHIIRKDREEEGHFHLHDIYQVMRLLEVKKDCQVMKSDSSQMTVGHQISRWRYFINQLRLALYLPIDFEENDRQATRKKFKQKLIDVGKIAKVNDGKLTLHRKRKMK